MSIEKLKVESHQELEEMIAKEMNQVERDLTVICSDVPINDRTTLDILCHDGNGQLVVMQLSVNEDDIMLLHGIQSLDYVDRFKSFLKATYNKHKIDDEEKPRLILVAPSFSEALRHVVESMKGIRVDLYEWEYLKLGENKGFRLQPIFAWKPEEKPKEKPAEKRHEPKNVKKKEPAPEYSPEMKDKPPEEVPTFPPPQAEEPKEEEKEIFKPEKEPKRKLKLF